MGKDSSHKQQDRRSGEDRRQYSFTLHIPERRKGNERRIPQGKNEKSKKSSQNVTGQADDSEPSEES